MIQGEELGDSAKSPRIEELEEAQELKGTLGFGDELMKSVLEADKDMIDKGKLIKDALNRGIGCFTPDLMMAKFVENFRMAKKLYGETLIRKISGYDPRYIERNIKIPEFRQELQQKIDNELKELRREGLIDKDNSINEKGIELAALQTYVEELDNLTSYGFYGEKVNKKRHLHGMKDDIKNYSRGDKYRDISVRKSFRTAIRRGHQDMGLGDLRVHERKSKGEIEIVYAIDSSSSMKGDKLSAAKRAGVALSFKAIDEKDKVGLMAFSDEVFVKVYPSKDFGNILKEVTKIYPRGQTDISNAIKQSIDLFSSSTNTKHLIILSDALPTAGDEPHRNTLDAVATASAMGITISLIGLGLDKEGEKLGAKIVEVSDGRFYVVQDVTDLDSVVLMDYYSL